MVEIILWWWNEAHLLFGGVCTVPTTCCSEAVPCIFLYTDTIVMPVGTKWDSALFYSLHEVFPKIFH